MLKTGKFAALAFIGALAAQPAFAEEKSAAMVNGTSIPQARVDMRAKAAAAQGQPDSPELRKMIREDLINLEVMAQEATKLGLNKNDDVVQEIELSKQSVLVRAFVQDYTKKHPISEDQLKQEYDKLKAKLGNKEFSARHILVATQDEAKAIIAQLGKKAKFEKLAEKSMDSGSAHTGGALGWAVPSNFVPPFAAALQNLKKGEYTKEPVESQFGWHVIKLDDTRDLKVPPFEELRPQLQQRLQQQAIQQAIIDLKAKAKIE
ncbi:MAG TPA: peptidyl-prolyl cis-trans isomerase [Gallionella sp.]|nr:peptidyl-prolyl cis-trans isomerase [Gallionella sp.]